MIKTPRTIIVFTTGLSTGGAEMMLLKIVRFFKGSEIKLLIVSLGPNSFIADAIEQEGALVYKIGLSKNVFSIFRLLKIIPILWSYGPAVYQGWMYHGNIIAVLANLFRPSLMTFISIRKTLNSLRGEGLLFRLAVRMDAILSHFSEKIVFVSEEAIGFHHSIGYPLEKSCVIHNGFDVNHYRPDRQEGLKLRQTYGIPERAIVIGNIGRFHRMKNHEGFFRSTLPLMLINQDIHLLMVGKGVEAAAFFHLNGFECVQDRIHFMGEVADTLPYLRAMDIFCLNSSYGEGFPNVLGEAMATEVLCISTNVGSSKLVIGDTGVIIKPDDDNALRESLERLILEGRSFRENMGRASRDRIVKYFTIEETAKKFARLWLGS